MLDWPVNLPVRNSQPVPDRAGPGRPFTVTGYNYAVTDIIIETSQTVTDNIN